MRRFLAAALAALAPCHQAAAQPAPAIGPNAPPSGVALLGTAIGSGQATLAFTGISAAWQQLELRCSGIVGSANGQNFTMQIGTGATPTWATSAYQNAMTYNTPASATPAGYGATNDAGAGAPGVASWTNLSNASMVYNATLSAPSVASFHEITLAQGGYRTGGDTFYNIAGLSVNTGTTAPVTAVRVLFSAGNVASGQCSLYGLAN